ncbi:MAG: hypothetical protein BWX98_01163 [Candidatus Aminicenantes bacterium ADurb.Bin147]|nr:MAG: hypothetical protein BWX98_01163 [Candidatus Aminicenantes bacterium ADurb.Bin147]
MIGGRIETGVAPMAAKSVPKPTLMIMIWMILSRGARVLIRATTREMAPVSSMTVIW